MGSWNGVNWSTAAHGSPNGVNWSTLIAPPVRTRLPSTESSWAAWCASLRPPIGPRVSSARAYWDRLISRRFVSHGAQGTAPYLRACLAARRHRHREPHRSQVRPVQCLVASIYRALLAAAAVSLRHQMRDGSAASSTSVGYPRTSDSNPGQRRSIRQGWACWSVPKPGRQEPQAGPRPAA